ncbi:MAG: substrate-binding domain-containing protein [Planctomycetota bacterium]|jgi:ribose transport system substrate-binding protein|nr:substrate-binding domain-containing protein [Planctomycetota bacterium]
MKRFLLSFAFLAGSLVSAGQNPANADRTLVFVPKATNSQFWIAIWEGTKKAAQELGYREVGFQGVASAADVTGQVNIFNDVATSRPAGILIAVNDAQALSVPVERAIEMGVPVVTVNAGVATDKVRAHAATDNYQASALGARAFGRLIGGKGTVIFIGIDASSENGRARESGFRDTIAKEFPGIKALPTQHSLGDVSRGMNITNDLLTGNPDVVGIFCAQDNGGTGAAQALKQRGVKAGIKLVSFDASPDEFQLFLDGFLDALVVQDPFMQGYMGVYALDKVINDQPLEKKFFETPVQIITRDNLSDPEIYDIMARNSATLGIMKARGIVRK